MDKSTNQNGMQCGLGEKYLHEIVACTYLNNFTATVKKESVFFIVDAAQVVHSIICKCFQIERYLRHNDCWAHQFFTRIFRYHLHIRVAGPMNLQRQRCMISRRNAII